MRSVRVFTTVSKDKNNSLSFAGVYKILQLFETPSGKKLSSRAIRGSIVTNSRYKNMTSQEKEDLASSMNHTLPTAQRYYDYRKITDAVAKTLSTKRKLSLSMDQNDVPLNLSATQESILATPTKLKPCSSSTPLKSPARQDLNDSVISLRCRKVKRVKK